MLMIYNFLRFFKEMKNAYDNGWNMKIFQLENVFCIQYYVFTFRRYISISSDMPTLFDRSKARDRSNLY